jgi:hypothetical protein
VTTPRALIAFGLAVSFLAIAATSASAATTRAEFVAQVDPICQNGQAQEAVAAQPLNKLVKRVKGHDSRKLGRKLTRVLRSFLSQYATIEHAVDAQIATIPPATEDVSLVQVWLRARGDLVDKGSQLFTHGIQGKGFKGFVRFFSLLDEISNREFEVHDLVRDFPFQYCSQPQGDVLSGLADF